MAEDLRQENIAALIALRDAIESEDRVVNLREILSSIITGLLYALTHPN